MNSQAAFPLNRSRRLFGPAPRLPVRPTNLVYRSSACVDLAAIPQTGFVPGREPGGAGEVAARVIDVAVSLGTLVLLAPLMALLTILIRLDSTGPAIYRQERLGLNARPFTLLKFRSMRVDAESAGPAWASVRDPRVTRIGGFLRATRLDELPQLWNVLKGDMSLIGPRPERPHFVDKLSAEIPHFRARMMVKPGLTGWAQVKFRYGSSVEDARTKLAYDLFYVQNRSFRMNVQILLGTAKVILRKEGR